MFCTYSKTNQRHKAFEHLATSVQNTILLLQPSWLPFVACGKGYLSCWQEKRTVKDTCSNLQEGQREPGITLTALHNCGTILPFETVSVQLCWKNFLHEAPSDKLFILPFKWFALLTCHHDEDRNNREQLWNSSSLMPGNSSAEFLSQLVKDRTEQTRKIRYQNDPHTA